MCFHSLINILIWIHIGIHLSYSPVYNLLANDFPHAIYAEYFSSCFTIYL